MSDIMKIDGFATSELIDKVNDKSISGDERQKITNELMGRFPLDIIGELMDRIDELETFMQRVKDHLHSNAGVIF